MLSCKNISELASHKLDHKLTFSQRLQFRLHLMICHQCRQFMQQMQLTVAVLSRIKPVQTSPSVSENQITNLVTLAKKRYEQ